MKLLAANRKKNKAKKTGGALLHRTSLLLRSWPSPAIRVTP